MAAKYFWIKERHNPQFKQPYYVSLGQIPAKEAKRHVTASLYGDNYLHKFATKALYEAELQRLKAAGFQVQ